MDEEKKTWYESDLTKEEIILWDKAALIVLRYWIGSSIDSKEALAKKAYDYADAMLTERKRRCKRRSS